MAKLPYFAQVLDKTGHVSEVWKNYFLSLGSGGGGGGVESVSGTPNRITVTGATNPVVNIATNYAGQTSITTLGTVIAGTWHGTAVATGYGGTGLSSIGTAGQLLAVNGAATGLEYVDPPAPLSAGTPSALVGLVAVSGTPGEYMPSNAAPALNQGISPTWTGAHTHANSVQLQGANILYFGGTNAGDAGASLDYDSGDGGWLTIDAPNVEVSNDLDVIGTSTVTTLSGIGTRLVTSTAAGVLGNATTIAGDYTFSGTTTLSALAGSGTRYVTADASGVLGTTTGPAILTDAVILAPATSTRNVVQPTGDFIPLTLRANSPTITANLLNIENSGSAVIVSISSAGNLSLSRSASGTDVRALVQNGSNTASSNAVLSLATGGASGGDPIIRFAVAGLGDWAMGLDNSDGDAFVLSASTGVGTNNRIRLNSSGEILIGNGAAVSGPSFQSVYNFGNNARNIFLFRNAATSGGSDHAQLVVNTTTSGGAPCIIARRGNDGFGEWAQYLYPSDNSFKWKYNNSGSSVNPDATSLMSMSTAGNLTITSLAGSGSRMVVADSTGLLSTTAIPTGSVTGSGSANQVAVFSGASAIGGSGNLTFDGTTLALTGAQTISSTLTGSGNIILTQTASLIRTDTSDASDTKALSLAGGGAASSTRGAYLTAHGNEHGTLPGQIHLVAGAVASGGIVFVTNNSVRYTCNNSGTHAFATAVTMSSTLQVTGNSTLSGSALTLGAGGLGGQKTILDGWLDANPTPAIETAEQFIYNDGAGIISAKLYHTDAGGTTRFMEVPLGISGSGIQANRSTRNAGFTVEHGNFAYYCDAGVGGITVTLPTGLPGEIFCIKKTAGAGSVTLSPSGGSLDGGGSVALSTLNQSVLLGSDGTDWYVLSAYL